MSSTFSTLLRIPSRQRAILKGFIYVMNLPIDVFECRLVHDRFEMAYEMRKFGAQSGVVGDSDGFLNKCRNRNICKCHTFSDKKRARAEVVVQGG